MGCSPGKCAYDVLIRNTLPHFLRMAEVLRNTSAA